MHTVIPAAHVARFRQEEVDGVVDTLRTAAEAEVAAVFKQVGPTRWTISLRSRGRVDVAAAAKALGGGGHPTGGRGDAGGHGGGSRRGAASGPVGLVRVEQPKEVP